MSSSAAASRFSCHAACKVCTAKGSASTVATSSTKRAVGYVVVRTREELAALAPDAKRVLGLFARDETFNEADEATLKRRGVGVFQPQAPRFEEMISVAMRILAQSSRGFFLAANDETTDNLAGENSATAVLEAGAGADRAIAVVLEHAARIQEK